MFTLRVQLSWSDFVSKMFSLEQDRKEKNF